MIKSENNNLTIVKYIGPVTTDWGGIKEGGGVSTHIQGLLQKISNFGVSPHLLADNTDDRNRMLLPKGIDLDMTQFIRPTKLNLINGIRKLGLLNLIQLSYSLLKRKDNYQIPFQFRIKFTLQAANFKLFLSKSAYDILHIQHAEFRQYLCQEILKVTEPIVITAQSVNILNSPDRDWKKQLVLNNYTQAKWIIAVSSFVRDKIAVYASDSTNIRVIPNGVDTEIFRPVSKIISRNELNLNFENIYAFFSGNLIQRKGIDILLHAIERLHIKYPRLRCIIAGRGPESLNLMNLAKQLNIQSIVDFVGFIPISKMPIWYQAADIFIMPSESEGLSLSVLEALSCGIPVITSQPSSGNHDAIIPYETGLLTPYGDRDALSQAIKYLIDNENMRRKMGHNTRKMAEKKFDWNVVAKSTADFYQFVLSETRG